MGEPAAIASTDAVRLYDGDVTHARLEPFRHQFRYRVFSLLLDIDRIGEAARASWLFAHNRFGLVSFRDEDHGPRDGSPLRPWVEQQLASIGVTLDDGPVQLLCFPRILGYVFNPISVYYCHGPDGTLRAVIYEVANTFGDTHAYVLPAQAGPDGLVRQATDKVFYVSPFMAMDGHYAFAVRVPGERLRLAIRYARDRHTPNNTESRPEAKPENRPEPVKLMAILVGVRRAFTDTALAGLLLRQPFMTLKVTAGIHWEAVKLWFKGATYQPDYPPNGIEMRDKTHHDQH